MIANSVQGATAVLCRKGWLDKTAVFFAVLCGIHCLATPVLLVALPILGASFWTSEDFHLWMLALVIPTTALAVFSGCRRHKDRIVVTCAVLGLSILVYATALEASERAPLDASEAAAASGCCSACSQDAGGSAHAEATASLALPPLSSTAYLNLAGGLFLIMGHLRNFRLCRRAKRACGSPS